MKLWQTKTFWTAIAGIAGCLLMLTDKLTEQQREAIVGAIGFIALIFIRQSNVKIQEANEKIQEKLEK